MDSTASASPAHEPVHVVNRYGSWIKPGSWCCPQEALVPCLKRSLAPQLRAHGPVHLLRPLGYAPLSLHCPHVACPGPISGQRCYGTQGGRGWEVAVILGFGMESMLLWWHNGART